MRTTTLMTREGARRLLQDLDLPGDRARRLAQAQAPVHRATPDGAVIVDLAAYRARRGARVALGATGA